MVRWAEAEAPSPQAKPRLCLGTKSQRPRGLPRAGKPGARTPAGTTAPSTKPQCLLRTWHLACGAGRTLVLAGRYCWSGFRNHKRPEQWPHTWGLTVASACVTWVHATDWPEGVVTVGSAGRCTGDWSGQSRGWHRGQSAHACWARCLPVCWPAVWRGPGWGTAQECLARCTGPGQIPSTRREVTYCSKTKRSSEGGVHRSTPRPALRQGGHGGGQ